MILFDSFLIESIQSEKYRSHHKGKRRRQMERIRLRKAARLAAVMTAALMLCLAAPVSSFAENDFIIRYCDVRWAVNKAVTYQKTKTVKV